MVRHHPSIFRTLFLVPMLATRVRAWAPPLANRFRMQMAAASTETTTTKRLPKQNLSIDIRSISSNLDTVLSHLTSRKCDERTLAAARRISEASQERSNLIQEKDRFLSIRKEQSAIVGTLMRDEGQNADAIQAARDASNAAAKGANVAQEKLDRLESEMDDCLRTIPNLLDDRVPEGKDDTENEIIQTVGDIHTLPSTKSTWVDGFEPKWHDDVAGALGGYQAEAAVEMSGSRFVALSGDLARLERAIGSFFIDLHSDVHQYTEVSVPFVVSRSSLEGTSQLPKFEEDLFKITPESHTCNGEDAFLIPTAEVPVTNMHRGQVLEEEDLPISYVAWTPCFRAEAGSAGRDTRGLFRQHQFHKVELVKITTPKTSDDQHEILTTHAEQCLKLLELPYRKVRLCAGDIGFSARHCYDLEVYLPGPGEYREISSCSNTGDFQARRMAVRYRPKPAAGKKKKPKPVLCHTINGSGMAVGRTLVAILENYQQPDGSVVVPKVLRPYMGGKEVLQPAQ